MRYDELAERVLAGGAVTKSEALEMLRCPDGGIRPIAIGGPAPSRRFVWP